ncbi:N/A [soil metagenome]
MKSVDTKAVILADPDPNVRELVGRFLAEAGYTVTIATNGYDALDSARLAPPVALFADIMLPKLDGLTLCRLLKEDAEVKDLITIIVFSVLSVEEKAIRAGANAFIKKPVDKDDILNALGSIKLKETNS